MPVIVTQKPSKCVACGGGMRKGEEAYHSRGEGTRHVECQSAPATQRTNTKRANCCLCHRLVPPGEGFLSLASEHARPDGTYERRWKVTCLNGCRPTEAVSA